MTGFVTEINEKKSVESGQPPAYPIMSSATNEMAGRSRKTKALYGYAIGVTTAFVVLLIFGGIYYYKSIEVLQDAIKTYRTVDKSGDNKLDQEVDIDTSNNQLVFRLNGEGIAPGTFAVQDYTKSITGIYDPKERKCYLLSGINKEVVDPRTYSDMLEKNTTASTPIATLNYQIADSYPVSDKSVIPSKLRSACQYLPVYWLEPAKEAKGGKQKRAYCIARYCWRDCCYIYCYYNCYY